MAKLKNQSVGKEPQSRNPDPAAPDIESQAEAAVAVAEHEGPVAKIGPADAIPSATPSLPAIDPIEAAARRRKAAREDAVNELRATARRVADGETLTDAENERVAELCDLANWTTGLFKAEVQIARSRLEMQEAHQNLPRARKALEDAQAEVAEMRRRLADLVAEAERDINAAAGRVVAAQVDVQRGEAAQKELMKSAPAPLQASLNKARNAQHTHRSVLDAAEKKLNSETAALARYKGERQTVGDGTAEGDRLDHHIATAVEAVRDAQRELNAARERSTEIAEQISEIEHLCVNV